MKKIILVFTIIITMFSLCGCNKNESFSSLINKLGSDVTITLVNCQSEDTYNVPKEYKKIILDLLKNTEYQKRTAKPDHVNGLYSLNIKGKVNLVVNESYFMIDEDVTEIKNNNSISSLIEKVKYEVIKSKYLIIDSDKYNIYTTVDELKTSGISYDESVYTDEYFEQKIVVTVEFNYNDTESNIKCVNAYSIASLIYLDFTIDSPTPYNFDAVKKTTTFMVEMNKPTSYNNNKVSILVNNVNEYLEGEYISCYYDCRSEVK